ncbi:MAG: hypothetical protein RR751_07005 [Clostridia bacterium]
MNKKFSKVVLGTIIAASISVPFSNVLAATEDIKNPNTSDYIVFIMLVLAVIGVGGLAFVAIKNRKKK